MLNRVQHDTTMKTEIVILPNPNQLILLRAVQKKFCAIPMLPICVRCEALQSVSDNITKAEPAEFFSDESKICLKVKMKVNGSDCNGRIELAKSENLQQAQELLEGDSILLAREILSKIKKISPFRIAEMETEFFENGSTWRITREKWGKIT